PAGPGAARRRRRGARARAERDRGAAQHADPRRGRTLRLAADRARAHAGRTERPPGRRGGDGRPSPMIAALYRLVTDLGAPALRLLLARRRAQGKEDPARLAERFGEAALPRPEGPLVWLHAASVG